MVPGWAVEPRWRALLCAESKPDDFGRSNLRMPLVDQIHRANTRRWSHQPLSGSTIEDIFRIRRELKKFRYDVCIDLQGSIRSAVISRWSRASRVIGPQVFRANQPPAAFTRECVPTNSEHVIEQALELADTIAKRTTAVHAGQSSHGTNTRNPGVNNFSAGKRRAQSF